MFENVPLVVVAKGSGDFVVGHVGSVSVLPPESSKGLGVMETKQSFLLILPAHHVLVLRLLQNSQCELPKLSRARDICSEEGEVPY